MSPVEELSRQHREREKYVANVLDRLKAGVGYLDLAFMQAYEFPGIIPAEARQYVEEAQAKLRDAIGIMNQVR